MKDGDNAGITPAGMTPDSKKFGDWEHDLINRLVFAGIREQRRARRWNIFFRSLLFLFLLAVLLLNLPEKWSATALPVKHTALVDLQGEIADNSQASAEIINKGLKAAFDDSNTVGVILRINSPGGSPVQAGYINDEIGRLRSLHPRIPLYVVITDLCASGGYYVAVAANKIYADKASLVGSIGVLMDGFGFTGTLDKLGVERRLYTAGEHKGFLDPFSPSKPEDVQQIHGMLADIHQQFIATVKKGRGARLRQDVDLFNGWAWTGEQSVSLGLVDGLANSGYVARELIHQENIVDFTPHQNYLNRLTERLGMSMANAFLSAFGVRQGTAHLR